MIAGSQPRSSPGRTTVADHARRHPEREKHRRQPRAASMRLRRPSASFLLALVTIFALWWQSTLVETHIHALPAPILSAPTTNLSLASTAGAHADETHQHSSPQGPDNCPICHERRMAGLYLWPTLMALVVPALPVFWARPAALRTMHRDARSHNWQSRAPPHRL